MGYQDHYELREQLIHTNIQFATTISSIQHVINTSINSLMDRVSLDVGFDEPMSEYVKISLVPPVSLILQLVESTITSVSNIQRVFMEMPVLKDSDPTYLLRRYVPYIVMRRLIAILIRKSREFSEPFKMGILSQALFLKI